MFSSSFYAMNNANGRNPNEESRSTTEWILRVAILDDVSMTPSSRCVSIWRIRRLRNKDLTRREIGVYDCFIKRFEPRTDVTPHRKPDVRPLHDGAVNPYREQARMGCYIFVSWRHR